MNNAEVLIKFKGDTKDVDNSVKGLTKDMGSLTKSITLGNLAAKGIAKGFQLISQNMDSAIKRVDTLNNFPKVMSNLGISTKEADKQIKRMSEELAGLPTTLDQGAMAVQRFTSKNSDVKKSTDIFLALNNALLAGGASTDIQATALEQLSQAYAKGKPDMMEWRSIQTAMPAQLKQVAIAMGYAGGNVDALGEDLRKGNVSMDKFMDTIIELNEKGGNGFKSFSKQARNSTAGIGTAITVAKTQVVKGITSMIEGLNKGLKKAKLGSISDIIANIGKQAKTTLDGIAKWLSKIDFKGLINTLSKLAPIILGIVAAFITYNTVVKLVTTATKLFFAVMNTNPIVLAISAIVALASAMVMLGGKQSEVQKSISKTNDTLKQYEDNMKQIQKTKDQELSKSMNEIAYYQSLNNELKNITDENGKVKSGYEDRASFITSTLSDALGVEIKMSDGVIKNYQEIQKTIEDTITKKKALAYFNAHEEEYNQTLKDEATLQKSVATATNDRDKAEKELLESFKKTGQYQNSTKKQREDMIKYLKGEIEYEKLSIQEKAMVVAADNGKLRALKNNYQEAAKVLEKSNKDYAKNQSTMERYRRAEQELAAGHYEAVQKIFTDTVTFNAKTEQANNQKYQKAKAGWNEYRNYLKENKDKFDQEFYNSEMQRIDKELQILDDERNKANAQLKQKNTDIVNTTIAGINDQLSAITSAGYEFRDAGNGNVQLYVNGIATGKPIARNTAADLSASVTNMLKSGEIDANVAGQMIVSGLNKGMIGMGDTIKRTAKSLADTVIAEMNRAAEIHSPSRRTMETGKYLVLGITKGMDNTLDNALNTAQKVSNGIIDNLNTSMNISPQLAASSSLHYSPNVIVNNQMNMRTDPLGQVVGNIKTFANGSKNDYNYGMGS